MTQRDADAAAIMLTCALANLEMVRASGVPRVIEAQLRLAAEQIRAARAKLLGEEETKS